MKRETDGEDRNRLMAYFVCVCVFRACLCIRLVVVVTGNDGRLPPITLHRRDAIRSEWSGGVEEKKKIRYSQGKAGNLGMADAYCKYNMWLYTIKLLSANA